MTVLRYTVPPENDGCRLGLFLRMQGVTAGLIKSVKYDGDGFFADGRPVRTNEPVHTGQCIHFALPPEQETSVTPQPVPFSVAYEDAFAAVLDKPAGIAVHPTLNYPDGTLANGWLYRLHQQGKDGIFRPVNRIDKNTSGLVLCAQNAFAAPLLVYNDEAVDAVESEVLSETYRAQLQSWWNITDRDSTLEIVRWLLLEGHHADADAALALMRGDQSEAGDPEEKAEDVQAIAEFMVENGYCTVETLPQTVIAWDLVRIANLGRWALHAGYLSEEEMWQVMQVAADTAREHFSSWEEYGRSFAFGRGVWHGDEEDCQTAWEIVTALLEEETSPWQQIPWNA